MLVCEDTRVTRKLLTHFGIPTPRVLFSAHEHNEHKSVRRILGFLDAGDDVGYCSDAGMPGISDPGFLMIREARAAGHAVEVYPGPSAVVTALVASGLPSEAFSFLGFPPRKTGQRRNALARLAERPDTLIFFESPHRLGGFLADAQAVLGDRRAAVCANLTKMFERIDTGWLADLARKYEADEPRGEVTVVIAGNSPKFRREPGRDEDRSRKSRV